MDFFIIINPSVHTHTHIQKVFSVLYKAQFKAAFRNKRQNKCYCYSQYTDVYSYLPPSFLSLFLLLSFGDIISRTCLYRLAKTFVFWDRSLLCRHMLEQ